jgi:hypothetical protein
VWSNAQKFQREAFQTTTSDIYVVAARLGAEFERRMERLIKPELGGGSLTVNTVLQRPQPVYSHRVQRVETPENWRKVIKDIVT